MWVIAKGEVVRGKVGFYQWRVVDRHFHDVQDVEPIPVLIFGDPEKLFDCSVHSLGLSVSLLMEGARWSESDVEAGTQLFPEDRHEPCVSVRDDGAGQSVVLDDVPNELVGGVDGRGFLPRRDEVGHFGGPVCHREHAVVHASVSGDLG